MSAEYSKEILGIMSFLGHRCAMFFFCNARYCDDQQLCQQSTAERSQASCHSGYLFFLLCNVRPCNQYGTVNAVWQQDYASWCNGIGKGRCCGAHSLFLLLVIMHFTKRLHSQSLRTQAQIQSICPWTSAVASAHIQGSLYLVSFCCCRCASQRILPCKSTCTWRTAGALSGPSLTCASSLTRASSSSSRSPTSQSCGCTLFQTMLSSR